MKLTVSNNSVIDSHFFFYVLISVRIVFWIIIGLKENGGKNIFNTCITDSMGAFMVIYIYYRKRKTTFLANSVYSTHI